MLHIVKWTVGMAAAKLAPSFFRHNLVAPVPVGMFPLPVLGALAAVFGFGKIETLEVASQWA